MIYILTVAVLSCFVLLFDILKKDKLKNFFYVLEAIFLILLAACRFRVGGDALAYEDMYKYLPTMDELLRYGFSDLEYQPFWYLLNALIKLISDDFFFFQLAHALIINISIFIFFHRYCRHKFTMVLFYFIFLYPYFNFEILREAIAVVIFLYAYPKIFKKKYLKYYLMISVAFLFHASSIFLFFVPFIVVLFKRNIGSTNILIIGIIIALLSFSIVNLFIQYLPVNEVIIRRLDTYASLEFNLNGVIMGLFRLVPAFLAVYIIRKTGNKSELVASVINIYFILGILAFIVVGAYRLLNYFSIFYYIILVELILYGLKINFYHTLKGKIIKNVLFMLLFINIGYYYVRDMSKYNYGNDARFYNLYVPYNSVLYPEVDLRRENIFFNSMSGEYQ